MVTAEKQQPCHPTWFAASRKGTASLDQVKPADCKVNRQHHTQEVQPERAEGHRRAAHPAGEDTELRASFGVLSNTSAHGWTRHLGEDFYCCCIASALLPFLI